MKTGLPPRKPGEGKRVRVSPEPSAGKLALGVDPDANPLTSFRRDDDFTDELIKGICGEKELAQSAAKAGTVPPGNRQTHRREEKETGGKKKNNRKIRKGIR